MLGASRASGHGQGPTAEGRRKAPAQGGGRALPVPAARATQEEPEAKAATLTQRLPLGPALGQCCGGAVTLVHELIDAAALAAIPETGLHARRIEGSADMPLAIARALRDARGQGKAATIWKSGWLAEPVHPPARPLWVWGAGHVGRAIVATIAPLPDFAITWLDTGPSRFPQAIPQGVTLQHAPNPADLVTQAPSDAEHLILTFSHALDLELCHRLLAHGFASAGLIGSKSKAARFRSRLRALGHSPAQIARIRCPIGDPALGKHPQAIALGVGAALLKQPQAHSLTESAG
ncbi:MAG: xanthine dehydrogenase accessory protein XdhC [Pararhodobacter sp.]|nr:xanthine dehydrogenase accessory protein XdhC [Pararhodobacter sp.]